MENFAVRSDGTIIEPASANIRAWWPACLVVFAAVAVRLKILFSTNLVPQTDGAYYLAQVQSLVTGNGLRFSDTPLLFWLQSLAAQVIMALTNLSRASAIILGVKIVDAIVPPLAALPVFALWLRWTPPQRRSALAGITVAALPALSFGLVQMTGDLQKNAFALVFLAVLMLAFDTALRSSRARDWLVAGLSLAGCALSHIGVFAAAVAFLLPALVTMATAGNRTIRISPRLAYMIVAGLVIAGGAVYTVSLAIPKMAALWKALLSPMSLFEGGNIITRLASGAEPDGDMAAVLLAWVPLALMPAVWRRAARDRATTATTVGAALAAAAMSFPLLGGLDGLRLHIMAYLPVSVVVALLVGNFPRKATITVCAVLLLVNMLAVAPVIPRTIQPTIAEPSYTELQSLRNHLDGSRNTVVVARHGLEWWAAWVFGSDAAVVPTVGATPSLWNRYERVLLLQEIKTAVKNAGPKRYGPTNGTAFRNSAAPVAGATVIYEGEWYRLSEAPTVLELGPSFEGTQRGGTLPRPEPK